MDDWAFKLPKKILKVLLVGAMVISIGWGVVTWNSQKAMELWTTEVTFITKPIFNFFTNRAEKLVGLAFAPFFEQMEKVNDPDK
jgi:hypothetical protein